MEGRELDVGVGVGEDAEDLVGETLADGADAGGIGRRKPLQIRLKCQAFACVRVVSRGKI